MSSKYKKGNFYIRRVNEADSSPSFIAQIRLIAVIIKKGFVLVRHGYPGRVFSSGFSKKDVEKSFPRKNWSAWNEGKKQKTHNQTHTGK